MHEKNNGLKFFFFFGFSFSCTSLRPYDSKQGTPKLKRWETISITRLECNWISYNYLHWIRFISIMFHVVHLLAVAMCHTALRLCVTSQYSWIQCLTFTPRKCENSIEFIEYLSCFVNRCAWKCAVYESFIFANIYSTYFHRNCVQNARERKIFFFFWVRGWSYDDIIFIKCSTEKVNR